MKNIILGVTGSIAAYKAADIAHQLYKEGFQVEVIMTDSATKFVTPLTFRSLTKNNVYIEMFQDDFPKDIKHISLAEKADLVLIAPATANIIGKLANGIGDDMLSTTLLAVKGKPVIIAPAMNTNMWENPILQDNITKLKKYGYQIIEPKESMLACGTLGNGALASVDEIVKKVLDIVKAEANIARSI